MKIAPPSSQQTRHGMLFERMKCRAESPTSSASICKRPSPKLQTHIICQLRAAGILTGVAGRAALSLCLCVLVVGICVGLHPPLQSSTVSFAIQPAVNVECDASVLRHPTGDWQRLRPHRVRCAIFGVDKLTRPQTVSAMAVVRLCNHGNHGMRFCSALLLSHSCRCEQRA